MNIDIGIGIEAKERQDGRISERGESGRERVRRSLVLTLC
jgi:hypothetical protein